MGLAALLRSPAATANQMISLSVLELSSTKIEALRRASDNAKLATTPQRVLDLIENAMTRALQSPELTASPSVAAAVRELTATGDRFRTIAKRIGRPQRTLSLEFRERVGMSPKRYQRLQRFRRALSSLEEGSSFANVAIDLGYADQAHLNLDFREFASMTPSAYLMRRTGYLGHVRSA